MSRTRLRVPPVVPATARPAWILLAWAVLLVTGCSGGSPAATPATVTRGTASPGTVTPTRVRSAPPSFARALAAGYLAIARDGNRRLEHDFDGLEGRDRNDLAAARADLRDAAATERLFDRRLSAIAFPSATEQIVRLLLSANQARARLADEAAASASLRRLHGYLGRLDAADGPVEDAVRVIRGQLGLPPPDTS